MNLVMAEYLEVNSIGIVLLLIMMFYVWRRRDLSRSGEQKHFHRMLILNIVTLLADNCIYLLRGRSAPELIALCHLVCICYFLLQGWFCYNWARYVLSRLYPGIRTGKWFYWLLRIPAIVDSLLVLSSFWTGWVYSLTGENFYRRGGLLTTFSLVTSIYWLMSSAMVIHEWRHPTQNRDRWAYVSLLVFPIPLVIGNALQLRFYGISLVWVLSSISVLLLFIDIQAGLLERDSLTGLYNRRQTTAQLQWELGHLRADGDLLFVAMIDVDRFKLINDRFGHLAGDQALTRVASLIRSSCRRRDFVGRFGGDEFLVICHVKTAEDADGIVTRINGAAAEKTRDLPYSLSLSIGYTLTRPDTRASMDEILDEADRKMYEVKRLSRAAEDDKTPEG